MYSNGGFKAPIKWANEGNLRKKSTPKNIKHGAASERNASNISSTMHCNANQQLFDPLKSCPEMPGVGVGMEKMTPDASSSVAAASPFLLLSMLAGAHVLRRRNLRCILMVGSKGPLK